MRQAIIDQLEKGPQTLFQMAEGIGINPAALAEDLAHLIVKDIVVYGDDNCYSLAQEIAA